MNSVMYACVMSDIIWSTAPWIDSIDPTIKKIGERMIAREFRSIEKNRIVFPTIQKRYVAFEPAE